MKHGFNSNSQRGRSSGQSVGKYEDDGGRTQGRAEEEEEEEGEVGVEFSPHKHLMFMD